MTARVVQLIWTDEAHRGRGTREDPYRVVFQLFTLGGVLVAEFDGLSGLQAVTPAIADLDQ